MRKEFANILVLILSLVLLFSQDINAFASFYFDDSNYNNIVDSEAEEKLKNSLMTKLFQEQNTPTNQGTTTNQIDPNSREARLKNTVIMLIGSPNAYINDIYKNIDVSNPNVMPLVIDGRALVPLRFISEGFGWNVNWDENSKTVTATLNEKTVKLQLDTAKMLVDRNEYVLDVPAKRINGRIFVPLRAFVENALRKSCFYYNGLIVISEKDNVFDSTKDSALLNDLIKELSAKRGNTSSNLENGGFAVSDGKWIYYVIHKYGVPSVDYIYKEKLDGTQRKLLYSIKLWMIGDLQIVNNKLYFTLEGINETDVYKMNTDGTGLTILIKHKVENNDIIWRFFVVGDYAYYCKDDGIYKMDLNDLKQVKIYDDKDGPIIVTVEGNKIYFEKGRLYSINTDGTNFKEIKLLNKPLNFIYAVSNGCIYYGSYIFNKETSINKLDLLTGKDIVLKKFDIPNCDFGIFNTINIDGEWIYYNDNHHNQIRKMKIDGTNDTVIFNSPYKEYSDDAICMNVAGGWVFASLKSNDYRIKSDGSSYKIFR